MIELRVISIEFLAGLCGKGPAFLTKIDAF